MLFINEKMDNDNLSFVMRKPMKKIKGILLPSSKASQQLCHFLEFNTIGSLYLHEYGMLTQITHVNK